jgi:hypothetical protein
MDSTFESNSFTAKGTQDAGEIQQQTTSARLETGAVHASVQPACVAMNHDR